MGWPKFCDVMRAGLRPCAYKLVVHARIGTYLLPLFLPFFICSFLLLPSLLLLALFSSLSHASLKIKTCHFIPFASLFISFLYSILTICALCRPLGGSEGLHAPSRPLSLCAPTFIAFTFLFIYLLPFVTELCCVLSSAWWR